MKQVNQYHNISDWLMDWWCSGNLMPSFSISAGDADVTSGHFDVWLTIENDDVIWLQVANNGYEQAIQRMKEWIHIWDKFVQKTLDSNKYELKIYNYEEGAWLSVSGVLPKEEADKLWSEKTCDGLQNVHYGDRCYYKIFPVIQ